MKELRELCAREFATSVSDLVFTYHNELQDANTLGYYKIKDRSVVHAKGAL
ncbi:hypothetical protein B0J17DRAFT_723229 [Rhizoctonia solani]|nr:hypothetical protein B0J17DRAFT_723229 [Rhizoctonia solani]